MASPHHATRDRERAETAEAEATALRGEVERLRLRLSEAEGQIDDLIADAEIRDRRDLDLIVEQRRAQKRDARELIVEQLDGGWCVFDRERPDVKIAGPYESEARALTFRRGAAWAQGQSP